MRVQKRFRITSRVGIDGIFEIFNAFNHGNFGTFTISETTVARSNGVLHLGSPAFNNLVAYQPRMALASQGKLDAAIDEFHQALALQPEFAEARRNLTTALQRRQRQ